MTLWIVFLAYDFTTLSSYLEGEKGVLKYVVVYLDGRCITQHNHTQHSTEQSGTMKFRL